MTTKTIQTAVLLLATAFLLTSCLKDDDSDYTYYNEAVITAFSLGTLNQYQHTTGSEGQDSVYKTAVTGSRYTFFIDQQQGLIYNVDSLPAGTDVAHVVATITTRYNGVVLVKDLDGDTYSYYSSTDSLDFSVPRVLRVLSQSVSQWRDYTVQLNVRRQQPDQFGWTQTTQNDRLASFAHKRAVALGSYMLLFGSDDHSTSLLVTNRTDGAAWSESNTVFAADAWQNVAVQGSWLYLLDGTRLLKTDGVQWSLLASEPPVVRLVGASTNELYGYDANGALLVSADEGATWTTEQLDDDAALLPRSDISCLVSTVSTNNDIARVMLVGNSPAASQAVVWTKLVGHATTGDNNSWSYVDLAGDLRYAAPCLQGLTAFAYDGNAVAFGRYDDGSMSPFLVSRDQGITWKQDSYFAFSDYVYPDNFSPEGAFTATVDADDFIWLFDGTGKVWKGKLEK